MVLEHTQYRSYLKNVFADRKQKNAGYSMHAFARSLGITQSAVSQIFAGKKNLSLDTALQIAQKLGLNETESEYFALLVQLETAKNPNLKESLLRKLNHLNPKKPVNELSVDLFRAISDWYHLVIRNMTEIHGVDFSAKSLSKKLGISPIEAETALERLCRLELIEQDPKTGKYKKTEDYVIARSGIPNDALRAFHRQMMEKAVESLYTQTPQEKVVGSETFAFSEKHMNEANQITEEYFQKMAALAKKPGKKSQVYHLGVQFFNVTKEKK